MVGSGGVGEGAKIWKLLEKPELRHSYALAVGYPILHVELHLLTECVGVYIACDTCTKRQTRTLVRTQKKK